MHHNKSYIYTHIRLAVHIFIYIYAIYISKCIYVYKHDVFTVAVGFEAHNVVIKGIVQTVTEDNCKSEIAREKQIFVSV